MPIGDSAKEQEERLIFERLAPLAGYRIAAGSIQQSKPPVPDIECRLEGGGVLAVELVALDADYTRTRLSNMFSTGEAWARAAASWPPAERQRLLSECRNVILGAQFSNRAGSRVRTEILRTIQARMLSKPEGFVGELFSDLELPDGLLGVTVHRASQITDGPRMSAPSAFHVLRPQVDKIKEKLTEKTYRTSATLELFAYSTHDEVDAYVDGLRDIEACIREHLPGSLFRRVWVFDAFSQARLKLSLP